MPFFLKNNMLLSLEGFSDLQILTNTGLFSYLINLLVSSENPAIQVWLWCKCISSLFFYFVMLQRAVFCFLFKLETGVSFGNENCCNKADILSLLLCYCHVCLDFLFFFSFVGKIFYIFLISMKTKMLDAKCVMEFCLFFHMFFFYK